MRDSTETHFSQVGFSDLLHLDEDHGGDLLGVEALGLALVLYLHLGPPAVTDDSEGPMLHVRLDNRIFKPPANQTLSI